MDISQRGIRWLKNKFKEENKEYSRWTKYNVFMDGDYIYLRDELGRTLGLLSLNGDYLELRPKYYNKFPCQNPNATHEEKVADLIDLLWYITSIYGRAPFYSGLNIDYVAVSYLGKRNTELRFNQTTSYLNRDYVRGLGPGLIIEDRVASISTITFPQRVYTINSPLGLVNMQETWIANDYIMINSGYSYYEPSGSWWETSSFVDGVPAGYAEYLPANCTECGTQTPRSSLRGGICPVCVGVPPEKIMIHNYSTRANNIFGFKGGKAGKHKASLDKFTQYYRNVITSLSYSGDNTMYLGIELEYECRGNREDALVPILRHLHDHAIIKSDGSLQNGVEIVTCPATYEEQVKALAPFFAKFPDRIYPFETCGVHIHISRGCLNAGTQGRLLAFMNNPNNKDKLIDLAGRYSQQYAGMGNNLKATSILRGGDGARYRMLNTTNQETLEFRLFKSTDKWEDMLVFMQFVCAIVEYCKPCNTKHSFNEHKEYTNFEAWLKDYRKDYPELHTKYYPVKTKPVLLGKTPNTVSLDSEIPL